MKNLGKKITSLLCSAIIGISSLALPAAPVFADINNLQVDAKNTSTGVFLDWKDTGENVTYYVYRSEDANIYVNIGRTDVSEYTDKSASSGKTYYYIINNQRSNPKNTTPQAQIKVNFAIPNTVPIKEVNNKYSGIQLIWESGLSNITYYVYKSADNGKTYKNIAETKILEYFDKDVEDWKTYSYIISTKKETPKDLSNKRNVVAHVGTKITKLENVAGGIKITYVCGSLVAKPMIFRQEGTTVKEFSKTTRKAVAETKTSGTVCTFIDTNVEEGKTYSYIIGSATSHEEKPSTIRYGKVALKEQKITRFENHSDGITVYFSMQAGVSKYRIFRKTNGKWVGVGDSPTNSFRDKFKAQNDTNYTYTIRALDENGKLDGPYNDTGFTTKYYSVVSSLKVANEADGQKLTWAAVPGVKYYAPVVYWPSTKVPGQYEWTSIGVVSTNSAKFKNVKAGTTYKYSVRPCANDKKAALNYDYATPVSVRFLTPPQLTKLKNITQGQELKWNAVSGVSQYRLFVRSSASESWKKVADVAGTYYLNKNVKNNTQYYYTIRGIDSKGNFITGYNSYKSGKFYSAPKITGLQCLENDLLVSWNTVSGVSRYKVMMKNNNKGSDTNYTTLGYCSNRDYWYVNNPKEGQIYDFVVVCADSNGNEISGWSYGLYTTYKKPEKQQAAPAATPVVTPKVEPLPAAVPGNRVVVSIISETTKECVVNYHKDQDSSIRQATVTKLSKKIVTARANSKDVITTFQYQLQFKDGKKEKVYFRKDVNEGRRIVTGYDARRGIITYKTSKTNRTGTSKAVVYKTFSPNTSINNMRWTDTEENHGRKAELGFYGKVYQFKMYEGDKFLNIYEYYVQYSTKDVKNIVDNGWYKSSPKKGGEEIMLCFKSLNNMTMAPYKSGDAAIVKTYVNYALKNPGKALIILATKEKLYITLPVKNSNFATMFKSLYPNSNKGVYNGKWYEYGEIGNPRMQLAVKKWRSSPNDDIKDCHWSSSTLCFDGVVLKAKTSL